MSNRILLVDGNYLLFKSYFSCAGKTSNTKKLLAVYIFCRSLFGVIKKLQISHLLIAFDSQIKGFRHQIYPNYKANRNPPPPELIAQIPVVKEILKGLNLAILEKPGLEADDIIATFSNRFKADPANKIYIYTGDKDLAQLISDNVTLLNIKKGKLVFLGINNYFLRENHHPWQICDLKTLAGDISDNIRGVRGIGKITALKLLAEYQSVESILKNIDKLKPRLQKLISANRGTIALNKLLVNLVIDNSIFEQEVRKNFLIRFSKHRSVWELLKKYEMYGIIKLLRQL